MHTCTAAPLGFTTGGRPSEAAQSGATAAGWQQQQQQQQQHHWGQAVAHMEAVASVLPGEALRMMREASGDPALCY
jgi:hypothetical protein